MGLDRWDHLIIWGVIASMIFVTGWYTDGFTAVEGFDVTPTVDTHREAAKGTEIQVYRFGDSKDNLVQYSDGSIVPSRTFSIERLNHTTGQYEVIGYVNVHGHKVKVDETDVVDISIGTTVRINPKN